MNVNLKGAEATLTKIDDVLVKRRFAKTYRVKELDERIRKLRTRSEFKIIKHLSSHGVNVPHVFGLNEENFEFELEHLNGVLLRIKLGEVSSKVAASLCEKAGVQIAKIHLVGVVHGDCTTSNLLVAPNGEVFVIDFGLSEMTTSNEERALDLQLFKKTVPLVLFEGFLKAYEKEMQNQAESVIQRLENIEKRGRYKKRN